MKPQSPPPAVSERWDTLMADAEATVEEYEERGWETLLIHTGDVTPLSGEPFGLDVLAPGNEFERLEETAESVTFDTSHVYRNEVGDARFFVIVAEASEDGIAVVIPAFLSISQSDALEETATKEGVMYTHVRPLSDDARVTFSHDDPALFF